MTQEPTVKHEPAQETNAVDDLPDYVDSPEQSPAWMVKLQEDQNTSTQRQSWDNDSGDYDGPVPYDHAQYFPPKDTKCGAAASAGARGVGSKGARVAVGRTYIKKTETDIQARLRAVCLTRTWDFSPKSKPESPRKVNLI